MANNNFKRFFGGIQVSYEAATDPAEGKIGEIYGNTTRNMLRICVSVSPIKWQDLFIWAGSAGETYSTMYWDDVDKNWKENTLLKINENLIYTPDSATGRDLILRAGSATDPGETGGDYNLLVGEGDAGLGSLLTNAKTFKNVGGATGVEFLINAGDVTDALAKGSKFTLEAGAGGAGGERGDFDLKAHDLLLNATNLLKVAAKHDSDVSSTNSADLYYNTFWNKYKYFNGTNWKLSDLKGVNPVDLYDATESSLPADDTTLIDNITILNGMIITFTAVSSPGYYHATVDGGGNIVWRLNPIGQDSAGGFTLGDKIFIKYGDTYQYSEKYFNGSAWISNTPIGTAIDSTLRWDGAKWIENLGIRATLTSVYRPNDNAADAIQPDAFEISGADKTAGTGDGGNVVVKGGSSAGGTQGNVELSGNLIHLNAKHSSDPSNIISSLLYYNETLNRLRYHDGTEWSNIEGPRSLVVVKAKDDLLTTLPATLGVAVATAARAGTTVTLNTSAAHGLSVGEKVEILSVALDSWLVGTTYALDEVIEYSGTNYKSLIGSNTGNQPDTSPTEWVVTSESFDGVQTVTSVNSSTQIEYETATSGTMAGTGGIAKTTFIDGQTIQNGDLFVFTALTNPLENNNIYKASVSSLAATWSLPAFGLSPSGTTLDGDGARVILGDLFADTTWFFDGSVWKDDNAGIPDDITIEKVAGILQVKDAGISDIKLESGVADTYLGPYSHQDPDTFSNSDTLNASTEKTAMFHTLTNFVILSSIGLKIKYVGNLPSASVVVDAYSYPGSGDPDSGTLIATSDAIALSGLTGGGVWNSVTFNFSGTPTLDAGDYYFILRYSNGTGVDGSNYLQIYRDTGGAGSAGYFGSWFVYAGFHWQDFNVTGETVFSIEKILKAGSDGFIDPSLYLGGFTTSIQIAAAGGATNYTSDNKEEIFTDTLTNTDVMTITLPANPLLGWKIRAIDGKNDWATRNVTVNRNGKNINGSASNYILNVNNGWVEFIYMDSTVGWRTIA